MASETRVQAYKLLEQITKQLETDLIQRWRGSGTVEEREAAWTGLKQLELLAGAIEDGIRKHSGDG